jgi:cytochrome c peroxidase
MGDGRGFQPGLFLELSHRRVALEGAIQRHYGAPANPLRDARLAGHAPTPDDTADLVAFLDSLTDRTFVTDPRFSLPKTACGKRL